MEYSFSEHKFNFETHLIKDEKGHQHSIIFDRDFFSKFVSTQVINVDATFKSKQCRIKIY